MYMCVAHSGCEVGGSEARMIIPADQTESREGRSKVEQFYVMQGFEIECRLTDSYQSAGRSRPLLINVKTYGVYVENNSL